MSPASPTNVKLILAAGARPNFVKIAPIVRAAERRGHEVVLVHTGQHHDEVMSGSFFDEFELRIPDHHLGAGSGTHAQQTARVLEAFEPVVIRERADWVVVVGDVNSTLGCALAAAKVETETGSRIAHVEAGLRSGDWSMPEEINRVLTDRLAHALLTHSPDAADNLAREGIPPERVHFVGNVMIDTLKWALPRARSMNQARDLGVNGEYVLATLHRPATVDDPVNLSVALSALGRIAAELPVIVPLHPRTRASAERFKLLPQLEALITTGPLSYLRMLSLMHGSAAVLTDSGGVQEETSALGVPCVTLRATTERPVTVQLGTNRLAPWPLSPDGVLATYHEVRSLFSSRTPASIPGWDGRAAERIIEVLEQTDR